MRDKSSRARICIGPATSLKGGEEGKDVRVSGPHRARGPHSRSREHRAVGSPFDVIYMWDLVLMSLCFCFGCLWFWFLSVGSCIYIIAFFLLCSARCIIAFCKQVLINGSRRITSRRFVHLYVPVFNNDFFFRAIFRLHLPVMFLKNSHERIVF